MRLESSDIVSQPIDRVYELVRDNLKAIVPFLPNVGRIDVLSREALGAGTIKVVNHWYAKAEIPGVLKSFVNPDLFSWKDTAIWNDANFQVDYELESFVAKGLFEAKGTNYIREVEPGKTEVKVVCDFEIHAERIPGVPKLLVSKFRPLGEEALEKVLNPNLTSLSRGLNGYFASL